MCNMYLELVGFSLLLLLNIAQCSSEPKAIEFRINEEVPINTIVANLSKFFSEDEKDFIFKFPQQNDEYTALFQIDNKSDTLLTDKRIDREALCDEEIIECKLDMKLIKLSSLNTYLGVYLLKVIVVDINDNAPYFESPVMSIDIDENLGVNSVINLKGAHDVDAGVNRVQFYELLHKNDKFDLKFEENGLLVGLVLKSKLDREETDFYKLTLIAKDNGSPQQSGSVIINLTVKDVNDNNPQFTNDSYNVDVYENASISSVILTLTAEDADAAQNGQVGYKFLYNVQQSVKKMFSVNENSGDITLKRNLDYEKKSKYTFKVVGFDYGFQPRSSIVSVTINVLNINDNQPNIVILHVSDNVSESDKIGDTIARISVSDKDDDDKKNGINCSLSNSYFTLDSDLNEIMIAKRIDYEQYHVHNVTIMCSDDGEPPLQSNKSFLVHVHDENDNPPVFKNPIVVSQLENHDFKAFQVVAKDRDSGINAEFYYKLLNDNVSSLFNISNQTGRITTDVKFDREENPELEFKVLAIDMGNPSLTGTATVILRIADVNDETPTFGKVYYEFYVKEGQVSSTAIGNVEAQDLDINKNGRLIYWISNGNESTEYFYVDQGILKTKKKLTYSKNLRYDFTVFASDCGTPPLFSWANVTVFVEDINDHAPYFSYPTINNNSISIIYDMMGTNISIAKVNARDADYGENAQLSYFLRNSPESPDLFRINHSTGEIRLVKTKKVKVIKKVIRLSIVVQDHGDPMLQNSSILFVKVDFGNYSGPTSVYDDDQHDEQDRHIGIILGTVTACLFACVILVICIVRKIDHNRRRYPPKKLEDVAFKKSLNRTDQSQVSLNIQNTFETTDVSSSPPRERKESESVEHVEEEKETDVCINDPDNGKTEDSLNQSALQGSCAALL